MPAFRVENVDEKTVSTSDIYEAREVGLCYLPFLLHLLISVILLVCTVLGAVHVSPKLHQKRCNA